MAMIATLHVMADARGRWRVLDDEAESRPLSEHTTATDAERAAWRHGAHCNARGSIMRGILLWVLGIPIPVIILLYLFHVI